MYAFKCRSDSKNKLKGNSKSYSKNNKSEDFYKSLFAGQTGKEFDKYLIRSTNHEIYLQRVLKSTLSQFDGKRFFKNETESKTWNYYY